MMNFASAMKKCAAGTIVQRKSWNQVGTFYKAIAAVRASGQAKGGKEVVFHLVDLGGIAGVYTPTDTDKKAKDWRVAVPSVRESALEKDRKSRAGKTKP